MWPNSFRCPFDIAATNEQSDVIVRVEQESDIWKIAQWVSTFLWDINKTALRVVLPKELNALSGWNIELKRELLPYATELSAASIEYELFPFLSYQMLQYAATLRWKGKDPISALQQLEFLKPEWNIVAEAVDASVSALLRRPIESQENLRTFIREAYSEILEHDISMNPTVTIHDRNPESPLGNVPDKSVLRFQYAGSMEYLLFWKSEWLIRQNREHDAHTFTIVTTPYYEEEWGRYSEEVTLVMTRMKDFLRIPEMARKRIRWDSNTVLQASGIPIMNLQQDMQPGWLRIPEHDTR